MKWIPLREAVRLSGLHPDTLRKKADSGELQSKRFGSHRRWAREDFISFEEPTSSIICYCRVSSGKQKDDLERQIKYLKEKYPKAEIVKDIGSGLNFKRKGLTSVLDRAMCGEVITLVVAYKDRLARFGVDLIRQVIEKFGGKLVVLNEVTLSPEAELVDDVCAIVHSFSCRLHGLRAYSEKIKKDTNLPRCESAKDSEEMARRRKKGVQ